MITAPDINPVTLVQLGGPGRADRGVVTTAEVRELIAANMPVAIGVSGGKDSCALAFATVDHLRSVGHAGPVVLVHSDLGRVEWKESLPVCERLAAVLGVELLVVRREAGDMMDRWLTRWRNNVSRYVDLRCVKLILPWSTPSMRFCTSELKTAVICRALTARFPGRAILSATGIRRQESSSRAKAEIAEPQAKLASKTHRTTGMNWNPIIEWSHQDVFVSLAARGFDLHEAYTRYGMSRVSCSFCIMSNEADLLASTTCEDNIETYLEMVSLEVCSTFAFQGSRWLGDVAPDRLPTSLRSDLAVAKVIAAQREEAEDRIPDHLLYVEGWPTCMPTADEAVMLSEVRRRIASLLGLEIGYTTPEQITARYAELMAENAAKEAAKVAKAARKEARESAKTGRKPRAPKGRPS